jgi:large subunit ribosomal protein L23
MKAYHHLIKGPIITEKTHSLKEAGNKLTLKVDVKANKIEIRKAVEVLFKVKVLAVNTIQMMGKKKKLGKSEGRRSAWKKAIVTLAPGEKIAGYEM